MCMQGYTEAQLLNKDHPEDGMFIAESPKVIGRALDAGYTACVSAGGTESSWKKMTKPDRVLGQI